jgi:colanic acid biosynthesis glycosyl transferase WcaI
MRILLLTTYFRPDVASTGVIMSKLADEFVTKGHSVTAVTSVPHYDFNRLWPEYSGRLCFTERAGAMRIYRMYTHVAKDKANVFDRILAYGSFHSLSLLLGAALPRHDVILAPSPPLSNGVIADFIGRLRGTPFVYNVQDIWPDVAVRAEVLKNEKMIRRLKKMESYVYRRASGVTVISEGFRRNLLAKGVPDEKISVIPNFVDTDFIAPKSKQNPFSKKHGIADKFVVLFAGNMGFSQGLETVLDAAKLLQKDSQIEFLMVGNGAGRSGAEAYLESLRLSNVRFLPFQPHEDLPDMYGAADVCLIPLRHGFAAESVPCKLFTIMAAGKPAIAAIDRGSDTWELLERAHCGLCVEPEEPRSLADAILYYFRNPAERLEAGHNARHCADTEFVPSNLAEKYLAAMRRAIGTGCAPVAAAVDPSAAPDSGGGASGD